MTAVQIKKAFDEISRVMTQNREYLISLDSQNGDGDLGIYMDAGFKSVSETLNACDETDLGKLFMKASKALNEAAPSSLGTILSIGLMSMAKALKGKTEINLNELGGALEAGLNGISEKAGSSRGEKTVIDALAPAIDAIKENSDKPALECFLAAKEAACLGSESTKQMKAVHGRAAYYAEKSIGVLDGGSVAGKLLFEGIYDSVK